MVAIAIRRVVQCRPLLGLILMMTLFVNPALSSGPQNTDLFLSGLVAYQSKDYQTTIKDMSQFLQEYPQTELRDMALFWLARAHFKSGHNQEAGRYIAQFFHDYPNSPLKSNVEPELARLATAGGGMTVQAPPDKKEAAVKTAAKEPAAVETPPAAPAGQPVKKPVFPEAEGTAPSAGKTKSGETAAPRMAATGKREDAAAVPPPVKAPLPKQEQSTVITATAPEVRKTPVQGKTVSGKGKAAAGMRAKAIAGFKDVIDRYPGSSAAASASAKLKELDILYPLPGSRAASATGGKSQTLSFEVGQSADLSFTLDIRKLYYLAGKPFAIPFTVVNRGNGRDAFLLESRLPLNYDVRFAARAAQDKPVTITPMLDPGEKFEGIITGLIPRNCIDGQKGVFPIKVASQSAPDITSIQEISVVVSAPNLQAVLMPKKNSVLPGDTIVYRIVVSNQGSADADGIAFRIHYPPQYEPAEAQTAGFRQESAGVLVLNNLKLIPAGSREFTLAFQVDKLIPAHQELFLEADLVNRELERVDTFLSMATVVAEVSGVDARVIGERLTAIPGQTLLVPIIVTNTGNMNEAFTIRADLPPGASSNFYRNLNRDGILRPSDQQITIIGPLAPRQEQHLLMQLKVAQNKADGSRDTVAIVLVPKSANGKSTAVTVSYTISRPVVELAMTGKSGRLNPGEVFSYTMTLDNRGTDQAKNVDLESILPRHLEILVSDPPFQKRDNDDYLWTFTGLGAGEKRNIKMTFRVKAGVPVGTNIQVRNTVTYEDRLGNRY